MKEKNRLKAGMKGGMASSSRFGWLLLYHEAGINISCNTTTNTLKSFFIEPITQKNMEKIG